MLFQLLCCQLPFAANGDLMCCSKVTAAQLNQKMVSGNTSNRKVPLDSISHIFPDSRITFRKHGCQNWIFSNDKHKP